MIVGFACSGSSTPPMHTRPTGAPVCRFAMSPTAGQGVTIVPSSKYAPMLHTKGISTTFAATNGRARDGRRHYAHNGFRERGRSRNCANVVATLS